MKNTPLSYIKEFIAQVKPFDTLDAHELSEIVSLMKMAYYPRNAVIMRSEGPPVPDLHIIESGAVKVAIEDQGGEEIVVRICKKGGVFEPLSLLQESRKMLFDITVIEDLTAILVPFEVFKDLIDRKPDFRAFFKKFLLRYSDIDRSYEKDASKDGKSGMPGFDVSFMGKGVTDLMVTDVLTCAPDISVRRASTLMSRRGVGSIIVKDSNGTPLGILTDADLRMKILAKGLGYDTAVSEVMSAPLRAADHDAYAFDALLDMIRSGVSHLLITENHRIAGIVSEHNFQMEIGSSPVGLINDIDKSQSVDEMAGLHLKIDYVLELLLRQGCSVERMVQLITELNDRITLSLLRIAEKGMKEDGFGSHPVLFCWMSLGSEGRREQTLRTDQDNAVIFANVSSINKKAVTDWFLAFSERVVDSLVLCGFPRCRGGIMASNPRWCQAQKDWYVTFSDWIRHHRDPLALRMASIFFDFRAIYENADFIAALRGEMREAIRQNRGFLSLMAKSALYNRPPVGFFNQFLVKKSGEHKNKLDLKMKGIMPIIEGLRVLALELEVEATNTLERLGEIKKSGIIGDGLCSDIREAYGFLSLLRIRQHLDNRARGEKQDNFIDPTSLNSLQRKMMKESFAVIASLQESMESRYQTHYLEV